jgi:hypothetical protein
MCTIDNQTLITQILTKLGENNIIVGREAFINNLGEVRPEETIIDILRSIVEENGLE